ncbi:MAG: TonB-dependent receptor [Caulobacteraceae bacterium]|nr:TonB-dependent receptor [Caulobacteraceae bacterium]
MSRPNASCFLLGGSALALLSAVPASAQNVPAQTAVGELTVTASRLPAPLSRTPDAYVVTEDQIDQRQSVVATDLLATVPGVSFSESGPFGGVASVRLRGAASDKTLVLVDGVPVNDPTAPSGGFDFSSLDLGDVSRIEVLTGPQGSLWGSDAIGGVVAITSREPNGLRASAEGGSLATYRETASAGQASDAYALGVSVAAFRTAGISKADVRDGNTEIDGFNNTTVALNGRVALTDRITLDARARYNHAATEYDGFGVKTGVADSNDNSDVDTTSGYVRAQVKQLLGFDHEVRVDLMGIDRQTHGAFPFNAKGDQQLYRWAAQRQTPVYGLAFGVEHKSAGENTGSGLQTENANGAYAIGRWTPTKTLNLTVSVRRDDPDHYAGQTTARGAVSYEVGAGFTLNGSVGQGFKAPSIFETTYPCFECATPGPAKHLKPERAEGWDIGGAWRSHDGALRFEATYFDLRVRDQINYAYPNGYSNIDRVRSTGVEAGGEARLGSGWSLRGSYTHDDAVDARTLKPLIRVPHDTGSASVAWQGGGWQADVGLRSQSLAPDTNGPIQPFTVAYVAASYAVTPHLSVTGRIENLADARYQEAYGYGEPGRMVLVGLRWR